MPQTSDSYNSIRNMLTAPRSMYYLCFSRFFMKRPKNMQEVVWNDCSQRRCFIGGSDARTIMGSNEAALIRLWREKRGEAEPEDLSGNLIVQLGAATEELNRGWYERNTKPECPALGQAFGHSLDGRHTRRSCGGHRCRIRGQVHAAVVILGREHCRRCYGEPFKRRAFRARRHRPRGLTARRGRANLVSVPPCAPMTSRH